MSSPREWPCAWLLGGAAPGPGAVCPFPPASTVNWDQRLPTGPPTQVLVTLDQRALGRMGIFIRAPECCEFPHSGTCWDWWELLHLPSRTLCGCLSKAPPQPGMGRMGCHLWAWARTARTGSQQAGMGGGKWSCFSPCPVHSAFLGFLTPGLSLGQPLCPLPCLFHILPPAVSSVKDSEFTYAWLLNSFFSDL